MAFVRISTGIFTILTVQLIGFVYWDRRMIISRAKVQAIADVERRA